MTHFECIHCAASYRPKDLNCPSCGAFEARKVDTPDRYTALSIGDEYRASVGGQVQRPLFPDYGTALVFARAVFEGKRKPEPM